MKGTERRVIKYPAQLCTPIINDLISWIKFLATAGIYLSPFLWNLSIAGWVCLFCFVLCSSNAYLGTSLIISR